MRTTLNLNDELLEKARRLSGLKEKTALWTLDKRLAGAARRLGILVDAIA